MDLVNVMSQEVLGTVTKKVPFIEGAEVTFYNDVPGDFLDQLNNKTKELGENDAGYWSVVYVIRDWNFSDKDGKKLEITLENFKKLPMKLQKWLMNESSNVLLTDEERKKGSPANS